MIPPEGNPCASSRARLPDISGEVFLQRNNSENLQEVAVVDSRIKTDFMGHGYFLSSPATFSDLILGLRYGRKPGAANGRPLTEIAPNYYILDDNYPQKPAPMPKGMRPAEESE